MSDPPGRNNPALTLDQRGRHCQRSRRRDMIRPDAGSLAQLSKGLLPDAGLMSMLASVEASIAAVEAVLAEDQGGGE